MEADCTTNATVKEDTCDREFRFLIYVISSCILCVVGIVGNMALLVTLCRSRSKTSSMNSLLFALTLADIVFLASSFVVIFFFELKYMHHFIQKSHLATVVITWILCYIIRSSQLAGIWITVQIAFERWLAISRPMKGRLSTRQTKLLLAVVVALSILYELPDFLCMVPECELVDISEFDTNSNKKNINANSTDNELEQPQRRQVMSCDLKTASWATKAYEIYFVGVSYAVMSFAVPLVSVISFNFMTFRTIRNVRLASSTLRHSRYKPTTDTRHSIMVVLISIIFLLIEMPAVSCRMVLGLQLVVIGECVAESLYSAGVMCATLYASVNFVLYLVCSKRLRQGCCTNTRICLHKCPFITPICAD